MTEPAPNMMGWLIALGEDVLAGAPAPWRLDGALQRAANGDVAALRDLACNAYNELEAHGEDDAIAVVAWAETITCARLAAAHGHARDSEVLVFLLARFAEWQRERGRNDIATKLEAAGLNLASDLADAGDNEFADMIERAADLLNADTIAEAARQRAASKETA